MTSLASPASRVQWLDHSRGLSIILIVLLHSSYALDGLTATGPMGQLIDLVRPFRLPALFFLSGLFLGKVINTPWRDFADRPPACCITPTFMHCGRRSNSQR